MRALSFLLVITLFGCGGKTDDDALGGSGVPSAPEDRPSDGPSQAPPVGPSRPPSAREHDPRLVGLWLVAQPFHAAYEHTFYELDADGTLRTGSSEPPNCQGHLAKHCVTGSVANCRSDDGDHCESALTCVFGDSWYSQEGRLGIMGKCSDGTPRTIWIGFGKNVSGKGAFLESVDGSTDWSHDNFDWAFRRCEPGATEQTCSAR